jgi:hypothetical protein
MLRDQSVTRGCRWLVGSIQQGRVRLKRLLRSYSCSLVVSPRRLVSFGKRNRRAQCGDVKGRWGKHRREGRGQGPDVSR